MTDDDDDVALDEGTAPAADVPPPEFVTAAPARGRKIDDKTRAAFAAIKAAHKGIDVESDGEEPVIGSDEPPVDAAVAGTPSPVAALPGVPPAPPAALVPEVVKQHELANQRLAAIEQREKALAQREAELEPLRSVRDAYLDDRLGAITGLLREWGVANEADMKAELADLITDISSAGLGIQVDPQIKARMDSRRALKKIDAYKAQASVKEKALAKQQEELQYSQWRQNTTHVLQQEILKPSAQAAYPFLAVEDNAGQLVLDIIVEANKRDGSTMEWTQAAKMANDYLKQNADGYIAKRRHLLEPAAKPGAPTDRPPASPGRPPRPSQVTTLTNSTAAAPQGAPPPPKPGEVGFSMAAHRRATIARFRDSFQRPDDE